MFLKLLFDSKKFFEDENKQESSITTPFLIVFINGLLASISTFFVFNITLPPSVDGLMPADAILFMIFLSSLISLVISFIIWFVVAGLFHFISYPFEPKGSFMKTLKYTGYGMVPMIFSSIISLVSTYYTLPLIENAIQAAGNDPLLLETLLREGTQGNPILIASSVFAIIFTIWSIYIWIIGVQFSREISFKNSCIVVGIPAALYLISLIYGLVMII